MSYDPLKRDSTWTMIFPGCYIDQAGCGHLFPHEFLAFLSVQHPEAGFDPNSTADYEMVVRTMAEQLAPATVKFVTHDRQEN